MKLPESFLEEVRARTPLAALVGRRVKLARSGRHWKACCPFHGEKTPSFYVYEDGYHCFGCGAHGDAIGFVMASQGASFMDAVAALAAEAGLDLPKPSPRAEEAERARLGLHDILEAAGTCYCANLRARGGAAALAYLRRRGLTDETIERFGLGWSGEGRGLAAQLAGQGATPALLMEAGLLRAADDGSPGRELFYGRVMFPIRDRRGRVISFGGRTLGDGQPKYVNGPESPVFSKRRTLYGLDLAREAARRGAEVVAVEGYMDVIALHQAGFAGAVAPLGTALTDEQMEVLWSLSPVPVLCFDGDAAGARAAARAAELALPKLAPDRTLRIATLPAGEDPDTLVRTRGAPAFAAALQGARPLAEALFDLLREPGATGPEQRAAFRARLAAAASRIGDKSLAAEYRRELLDRFFTSNRRGAPARPRPASRTLPDAQVAIGERVRMLTAILLRHPVLIQQVEEALATLAPTPQAARLHAAFLAYVDEAESLDSAALIDHLTGLRLAEDVAWALGQSPLPLPSCAAASAAVDDAEAGWWHIYRLTQRSSLAADVAAARREFERTPDEGAQRRLLALCAHLDDWHLE